VCVCVCVCVRVPVCVSACVCRHDMWRRQEDFRAGAQVNLHHPRARACMSGLTFLHAMAIGVDTSGTSVWFRPFDRHPPPPSTSWQTAESPHNTFHGEGVSTRTVPSRSRQRSDLLSFCSLTLWLATGRDICVFTLRHLVERRVAWWREC
jgi:hypothetical protein